MRKQHAILLALGTVGALALLAIAPSRGPTAIVPRPAPRPPSPPPAPPRPAPAPGPGERARAGDVVYVRPIAFQNLFDAPAGTTAFVTTVDAASPELLTGRVLGALTPQGEIAIGPFGSYTYARADVVGPRTA